MLKLIEFIKIHKNWKELLSEKPYSLKIKEDSRYIIFMYNQIESDMSNPVVQECRGLILRRDLYPVCVPFYKFHNVQESNASDIDWSTARVQEKLDGSIIKLWFDDGWKISTNNTIDATNAPLAEYIVVGDYHKPLENYLDLFLYSVRNIDFHKVLETLDTNCTYMFELVSPFNKIVVPYKETKLYHIGTRDNRTLLEKDIWIGIEQPTTYNLSNLDGCLQATSEMGFDDEGYVVVDAKWRRVKIKSPSYVSAHHLKNNGVVTRARVLEMILLNAHDDFLSIYPEYKDSFELVHTAYSVFIEKVKQDIEDFNVAGGNLSTRKEQALFIRNSTCPAVLFSLLDNKVGSVDEWVRSISTEKLLEWIGL